MNFLQRFIPKKFDKPLIIAFVALGLLAAVLDWNSRSTTHDPLNVHAEAPVDVDTMIPAGYLLVPIQLANGDSLSSLVGPYALIDLYSVSEKGKKGFKVASGVKLLRAPLNPQQFAVLLKEEESSKLVKLEGPFFAALKNPKDRTKAPVTKASKNILTIHYGE